MTALNTVADYVADARVLLQDTIEPYRYADSELVTGLNFALMECRKQRIDLFIGQTSQSFTLPDTTVVKMDEMYRTALLYYMCGHAQLRDDENTTDQRAEAFFNMSRAKLLTLAS